MSLAPALFLREGDRKRLGDLARLPSVASGLAKRAPIVLLAADGVPNAVIAFPLVSWRHRFTNPCISRSTSGAFQAAASVM
jgi:hypothetical protein